jgi:3-oxoacyl-[acyl-carrier-protein] synthase-3
MKGLRPAGVAGVGYYVPEQILTNRDLERMVETNDEWIVTRTGIRERRIAAETETTSDLSVNAARVALRQARTAVEEVQLIIVATVTPDYPFPATACLVQERLGAKCAAFDLEAGCSGFTYALVMACQCVSAGAYDTALVIGADVLSRIVNWKDRRTCVLFGDGAGAVVVKPAPEGKGLVGFDLGSDGSGGDLLKIEAGGSRAPATYETIEEEQHFLCMDGNEVFRFAVRIMGESADKALRRAGLTNEDVDCFIPHQANMRIIDAAARRLNMPSERVFINVQRYGNTSAASIPIAMAEAQQQGIIRDGSTVVCVGFGAGLTWGSCVLKW